VSSWSLWSPTPTSPHLWPPQDDAGASAVLGAVGQGHSDILELLLAHNGDLDLPNKQGVCPIGAKAANIAKNRQCYFPQAFELLPRLFVKLKGWVGPNAD